eukprot:GHRR01025889.1.p2 GENE.GHRR01025889.1~~GHRR01025889.1.p2  ORF type:complete len:172 (+),score=55.67 GHRR01025889.1:1546-2061(+)
MSSHISHVDNLPGSSDTLAVVPSCGVPVAYQAAICQFVGGDLPPTGRASDGLKQWQRAALQQLGLMAQPNTSASTSSAFSQLPLLQPHAAAFATDRLESPDAGAVYAQSTIRAGQQAQGSKARQVMVSIGSDPPVCSSLLAAVRVVLAAVSLANMRFACFRLFWLYVPASK